MLETEFGLIASDWKLIPSNEFCNWITDGTHDSPKEQKEGKYLITSKHIKGREIDFENAYLIKEEDFNKINLRSRVDQWDVIISMIGEYCGFCYVERNAIIDYAVKNVGILKTGDKSKALWLFYYLSSKIGKYILEINKSGTSQPYLTLGFLRDFPILFPNKENEADCIIEVLSSLDDKIDLLHRQNKTLEQLAETLFRQWFVEEAEESWEEKGLDEIAEFLNGLACQKFPRKSGEIGLPVIKIKEMKTGVTDSSDWATANVPEKYIIENGDMLFSWSGSLDIVLWFGGKGVLNQHLFKVSSNTYPQWFYYFWTQYHLQEFKGIADDKATTMGHIQRHHLSDARVIVPSIDDLQKMDETVNPIFQKIKSNTQQIGTLTQLRDTLLPKLMSGEVKVDL